MSQVNRRTFGVLIISLTHKLGGSFRMPILIQFCCCFAMFFHAVTRKRLCQMSLRPRRSHVKLKFQRAFSWNLNLGKVVEAFSAFFTSKTLVSAHGLQAFATF